MDLRISAVLSNMLATVKQRIGPLLGLFAIFIAINLVLGVVMFGLIGGGAFMFGQMENPAAMGVGFLLAFILFYIVYILVSFAMSAALVHHSSPVLTPSFGESFAMGFKRLPTLVGLVLLLLVAYFAFVIVGVLVGAVFSQAGDAGAILAFVLLGIVGIWLACRLAIMMPVIVVDGVTNPITAIRRSWALTRGNALRIFLTIVVFVLAVLAVLALVVGIFGGSFYGLSGSMDDGAGAGLAVGMIALLVVIYLAFIALLTIVGNAFVASLHAALAGPQTVAETFA